MADLDEALCVDDIEPEGDLLADQINWGLQPATPQPTSEPAAPVKVVTVKASAPDRLTEAGAAERFARLHGDDVRYDHRRKRWLLWSAGRWCPDADAQITRLALGFTRDWQLEAISITDTDERTRVFKAAVRLERREALHSMLALARDLRPVADAGTGWDSDPWLLGTPSGVVDLTTGQLREGRREDRITQATGVPYDPEARSELWDRTLSDIFASDYLVAFVQVAVGYSATGDTRRDCWFLSHGRGGNGKSTLLQAFRRALGEYALELPAAVLDQRRDGTPFDLAALPGRRFVLSSESGDTVRLHHDRVKQISGGDPVRAANKYEKSFEFQPTCKLWLCANRKPRVDDDSAAFWRRVMLIPFTQSFIGREDRNLRPALEEDPAHQAAILRWIVAGAVRYCAQGLTPPPEVADATGDYQREADPLGEWLAACIEEDPGSEIRAGEAYECYTDWAKGHGLKEREYLSATAFGRRMGGRFKYRHAQGVKRYLDIARRRPCPEE